MRVRDNMGSAGIDGITFEVIENAEEEETAFIAELQQALKEQGLEKYGLFKVPTTAG